MDNNTPPSNTDRKIKFWKKISLIFGLISLLGYFIVFIVSNLLAHQNNYGWIFFMLGGIILQKVMVVACIITIISLIRIIILSSKRKKHLLKDYTIAIMGILLVFSPLAASGILSFFRISWNNDGGVSVTLKSNDPYYTSGGSSHSWTCIKGYETSNDLKNSDINERYSYIDDAKKRKTFATEHYLEQIGDEILCQVGEFYQKYHRFPNEKEIARFSSQAISDDVRAGVYNIKLDVGAKPNQQDFTILFDTNCSNKDSKPGNVVVLTPVYGYGDKGRYCVYNRIDNIVKNIGKTKQP